MNSADDDAGANERSADATADGGVQQADALEEKGSLAEQFESIHQTRRRRAVGWVLLVAFIAFVFVQALEATELLRGDLRVNFFVESLREFFPFTFYFGVIPFLDVAQYVEFIRREELLYDPEIGGLLFSWPPELYTFMFEELGIFSIFGQAGITLAMGVAGTIMGFPLALLFGVLGSERVTPFPFNFIFRSVMSFIRAIPALVWTLIFIPFAGLGPASATIAIAFDTTGNLGRLFVDELEEIEDGPIEAMQTTGANQPQIVFFGMLSQVRSSFIAWTLYILEINVRIAVAVGVIGAGGLGLVVESQRQLLQFTNMMATLFCIFFLIISVELFSQRLRSRLRADEEVRSWRELILGFPDRFAKSMLK